MSKVGFVAPFEGGPGRVLVAALVIGLIFGGVAGLFAGWQRWKKPPTNHKIYRWKVIHEHASQASPGGTLIVGDSIIERQRIVDLCGPALNAGVGSLTAVELAPHMQRLMSVYRPARIVINVGVNDAAKGIDIARFKEALNAILEATANNPTLVVNIPSYGTEQPASAYQDAVRRLVDQFGKMYIGYPVPHTQTIDGIHLSKQGAKNWQRAVRRAVCPDTTPER